MTKQDFFAIFLPSFRLFVYKYIVSPEIFAYAGQRVFIYLKMFAYVWQCRFIQCQMQFFTIVKEIAIDFEF